MPTNKNAQLRYKVLDRCFSNFKHKYTIDELIDEVNENLSDLTGQIVSLRQIRDDIKYMRDRVSYNAPIKAYPLGNGRQCYYRYENSDFSIFNNELSVEEVNDLRSTIDMLGRFRGTPANVWLEEVISNLEYRFNIKSNSENLISFENNEQLKGLEYLSDIIDMTVHHQPINMHYCSFKGKEQNVILHPYYVKQYNNRWFLVGKEPAVSDVLPIVVVPLDRIDDYKILENEKFSPIKSDVEAYFKDIVGVSPKFGESCQHIMFKAYHPADSYIMTKPIHHSQRVVERQDDYTILSLDLIPTYEFETIMLTYADKCEILEPLDLREKIKERAKNIVKFCEIE